MKTLIQLTINGETVETAVEPNRTLLQLLRDDLGLTGTKHGCGLGDCGACTVILDDKAVRSCQIPVKEIRGKALLTIEGLARGENLHPLQKAFIHHGAFQCGFCTAGMILNAYGLLIQKPQPTEEEILRGMNDNLCRCAAHNRIVRAIQGAAKEMRG